MTPSLRFLLRLYDDAELPLSEEEVLMDEAPRAEQEAMRSMKTLLDERPPQRPSPAVLDAVRAAAASAAPRLPESTSARADRAPMPRARRRVLRRFVPFAATALSLTLAATLGVFTLGGSSPAPQPAPTAPSAVQIEAPAKAAAQTPVPALLHADAPTLPVTAAETKTHQTPPDDVLNRPAPALEATSTGAASTGVQAASHTDDEALPSWDNSDAVYRVYRNVHVVGARAGSDTP